MAATRRSHHELHVDEARIWRAPARGTEPGRAMNSSDYNRLVLRELRSGDEPAFLQALTEWPLTEEMEFAPKYVASEQFDLYVQRLKAFAVGIDLPEGWVPSETLFGFVGDAIVGRLQIRLQLNEFLWKVGGQVGYTVLPRFRRRGYAGQMLRQGLRRAKTFGMDRVLITCDQTNWASRRLIEAFGGERIDATSSKQERGHKLRYWVPT
jgi:predicted acetyltransferase